MRLMTTEETRKAQLQLLVDFKNFCLEHNIQFYLFAGSLLGAVRHGGFIPWDNDIDLAVRREDYERMKVILREENAHPVFRFLCFENNPGYNWQHGRIVAKNTYMRTASGNQLLGLPIDIFPLDSQGNDRELAMKNLIEIHRCVLLRIMCYDYKYKKLSIPSELDNESALSLLKKFVNEGGQKEEYWVEQILGKATAFSGIKDPKYYGCNTNDKYCVVSEASCYSSQVELDFEGIKLPAPVGYKKILEAYYGDYMKLPPEDKRKGISTTNIYVL